MGLACWGWISAVKVIPESDDSVRSLGGELRLNRSAKNCHSSSVVCMFLQEFIKAVGVEYWKLSSDELVISVISKGVSEFLLFKVIGGE